MSLLTYGVPCVHLSLPFKFLSVSVTNEYQNIFCEEVLLQTHPATKLISQTISYIIIIQILTGTVMKYHVSVDCQESYIFQRGYIFPKCSALRENITILAPPTRDISSVPSQYLVYLTVKINDFIKIWWCSMTITKFGNKTRSLHTKQSERKLDSFARFLLWRSIVNCCVLWLRWAFLSGSIS